MSLRCPMCGQEVPEVPEGHAVGCWICGSPPTHRAVNGRVFCATCAEHHGVKTLIEEGQNVRSVRGEGQGYYRS